MLPVSEITVLGLDNVLLDVGDLEVAKGFYAGRLGLGVKFDFPDAGVVGFRLGDEEAGLVVRAGDVAPGPPRPSPRLWLEVPDARAAGKALAAAGVAGYAGGMPPEAARVWQALLQGALPPSLNTIMRELNEDPDVAPPPMIPASTIATLNPSRAHSAAHAAPTMPAPMMTTSSGADIAAC